MAEVSYKEINAQSALNKLKRKIPYGWDLNIYRGCQHACQYCYAIYSHDYIGSAGFFTDIHCKTNIIEQLERELASPAWKREIVNIGGVTDSYQQAEEKFKLMPEILKLMIKYKTPIIISSKSNLILRDFDLIDRLSRINYVNIAQTITTMDDEVRQKLEPNSADSLSRFDVLKAFRKTNASIGLHIMPIVPYITDTEDNIDALLCNAAEVRVDYVLPGTLYLRGKTREHFFTFVKSQFPEKLESLKALYKTGGADKEYKNGLYEIVNRLRDKYELSSSYTKPIKEKLKKYDR